MQGSSANKIHLKYWTRPSWAVCAIPSQRDLTHFLAGQEAKADKKKNRPLGQTVASSARAPQALAEMQLHQPNTFMTSPIITVLSFSNTLFSE